MQALVPGMTARRYGRVVNLSSRAGQLAGMGMGFPAYRMSKAALNALTKLSAAEVAVAAANSNVKINCMCPGWCKTGMGGDEAPRSAALVQKQRLVGDVSEGGRSGNSSRTRSQHPREKVTDVQVTGVCGGGMVRFIGGLAFRISTDLTGACRSVEPRSADAAQSWRCAGFGRRRKWRG